MQNEMPENFSLKNPAHASFFLERLLASGIDSKEDLDRLFGPAFFVVVPADILERTDISAAQKLIYAEISALTRKSGVCFATNAHIARRLGVTTRTITQGVIELEKLGLIRVETKRSSEGTFRRIYLTWGVEKSSTRGSKIFEPGGAKSSTQKRNTQKEISQQGLYSDPAFIEFWELYPKKEGKGAAWRSWLKLSDADKPVAVQSVRDHLEHHANWKMDPVSGEPRDGGRFIPNPATFLNQRRFEDSLKKTSKVGGKYSGL